MFNFIILCKEKVIDRVIPKITTLGHCLFNDQLQIGINLDSISISQLSRRLNGLNPDLFQKLFLDLVAQIHVKTRFIQNVLCR